VTIARHTQIAVAVAQEEFAAAVRADYRREPTATELASVARGFASGLGVTPAAQWACFTDDQIAAAFRPYIRRAWAEVRVS
jgi:hypothetical protein